MAKRFRLREYAQGHQDLERVIVETVNRGGQKAAAERLGVSQASISYWLKKHGYIAVKQYVKQEQSA